MSVLVVELAVWGAVLLVIAGLGDLCPSRGSGPLDRVKK